MSDAQTMAAMMAFLVDPRPPWAERSTEVHADGCDGDQWEVASANYEPATPENGAIRDCYSFVSQRKPCTCGARERGLQVPGINA